MRSRNAWLLALGVVLGVLGISAPLSARAQGIAVLKSPRIEPFAQALAGFIAACDNTITEYDLPGSPSQQKSVIKRMLAANPTLILALGPAAAQVAKAEVQDIPVVFFMVPNPHKFGLEGKNVTGISLDIPTETQFTLYKSLVPALQTLGVIYDPAKTSTLVADASRAARTLGLQLLAAPVTSHKDVPAALRSLLGKIDALWMVPDDTVVTPISFDFLLLTAFEQRLPFLTVSEIFVEAGALASLSPDYAEVGRQACQLAREIERGRAAALQVFPPTKVNLALNLKAASKLGLTLPAEVIRSAAKVYQ
ncbi:MAG TPA: ABC transporter substrate-binding protein [Candidatus Tectomicrobia bacterium]|jgi:putative ABC transport system substrate-binding protein